MGEYLRLRNEGVRKGLVEAREMKAGATAALADIDRRLQSLPAELEALKQRGAEEIAAEQQRIRAAAERERQRLLEQTRREIDFQLRVAKRELQNEAADLSVQAARARISRSITADDQLRLVDRYLDQVRDRR
jgi:F0F1-type ATP synthase membrane subunit b/b'